MSAEFRGAWRADRRAKVEILLYGLAGGVLIAVLDLVERRSFGAGGSCGLGSSGLDGGVIALLFAGLGIRFGSTLRRTQEDRTGDGEGVEDAEPFAPDPERAAPRSPRRRSRPVASRSCTRTPGAASG